MSASYTTTKLLDRSDKKQRLKIVSSKVVQLHRPRRPRYQIGHKIDKDPVNRKVTLTTGQKRSVIPETRIAYKEMAENHSKPSHYSRHQNNETRCPRRGIPVTHSPIPNSRNTGPRVNFTRSPPQGPAYRDPRPRRSSGRSEQPTHPSGLRVRIKQASPPRRAMKDLTVNHLRGNRSSRKFISVPVAAPKRPTSKRPVACQATKRSLDVTRLAATKVPNGPFLAFFKEKVTLSQKDINRTSDTVNDIVPQILEKIRTEDKRFALKILHTGSYYEKLKVSRPGEFDVMLVFDAHRVTKFFKIKCVLRGAAGYASLEFNDHVTGGRKLWGDFLTRDGKCLSPRKTVERFYHLVKNAVATMRATQRRRISTVELNGPAVTLTIDRKIDLDLVLSAEILGWPSCASAWGDFSSNKTWPTRGEVEQIKMKNPKFHLVAKPCFSEKDIRPDSQVLWRISFSEAEKTLLSPASEEKKYYRIAKAMFVASKDDFEPLSSYDLKTLFLHLRRECPHARSNDGKLGESVVRFFASLMDRLKRGRLPHFFVPRADRFSEMSQDTRRHLACRLERFLCKLIENPERFLRSLIL